MDAKKPRAKAKATPAKKEIDTSIDVSMPAAEPQTEVVATATVEEKEINVAAKKKKHVKPKVIRDSFSFPEVDYIKITALKKICLAEGIHVKKGELLRAGLQLLSKMNVDELKAAVAQVEKIKTGRPCA